MYNYNLGLYFETIVKKYSDKCAIKSDHLDVTYLELNEKANQIANFLISKLVQKGDVIAIEGKKEVENYAFILACVKIGATYSAFDPDTPIERLKKIFERCLPKYIVAREQFENADTIVLNESFKTNLSNYSSENLDLTSQITGSDIAYIMFTSGSTGFPKGTSIAHHQVINLIDWSKLTYGYTTDDIIPNINPLYFDNSVFDVYSALFSGASLVPFDKQELINPKLILDKFDKHKITSWFSVPSMLIFMQTMKALRPGTLKTVKRIIFGGEGFPKGKLQPLYENFKDQIKFYNVYGPTECTCICSSYLVSDNDFIAMNSFLPLGKIAPNFNYIIVNDKNEILVNDEFGELVLGGPNVGYGYYNDPERTQSAFVQSPKQDHFTQRMYKTGDLVKLNKEDGLLHIGGRVDNQIKHMGYRIELEEIENALSTLNGINQVCVIQKRIKDNSRLFAFISCENEDDISSFRGQLKELIPDYMIPNEFVYKESLPKNANGKVDRKQITNSL